tara:strand:+ start:1099 stop:1581 length:483 start_codon:yes stop_codon:yes gene_type:complete
VKLSRNFSLKELTASSTAKRLGLRNDPTEEHISALTALCVKILQPIRESHGIVTVNSGLRVPEVNTAITGNPNSKSQHKVGEAADFECLGGVSNIELAKWIKDNLEFDQLILEYYNPKEGPNSGWVHCSYRRLGDNRKDVRTAVEGSGGKVKYEPGLPNG